MSYYPKSRIITGLISDGSLVSEDGSPYYGPYYITYKNEYFTGDSPYDYNTKKLISNNIEGINNYSLNTPINIKFNQLNPNINIKDLEDPPTQILTEPSLDYNKQRILRYFAKERKPRNFIIKEISKDSYYDIIERKGKYNYSKWDVIDMLWIFSNGNLSKNFVETQNQRNLDIKNKHMIGLNKYITNLTQFSKF